MDRVFERFVETIVTEQISTRGLEVVAQMPVSLTAAARIVGTNNVLPGVEMRPDLVVTSAGAPVAVADVNYKKTDDIGDFRNPDAYQVLAYCAALGVPQGLLIYADSQPHTTQVVELPAYSSRITLHVIGIDVSRPTVEGRPRPGAERRRTPQDDQPRRAARGASRWPTQEGRTAPPACGSYRSSRRYVPLTPSH
jgi:5-methylcytosine-specific restriction enzyme subunit McrC